MSGSPANKPAGLSVFFPAYDDGSANVTPAQLFNFRRNFKRAVDVMRRWFALAIRRTQLREDVRPLVASWPRP